MPRFQTPLAIVSVVILVVSFAGIAMHAQSPTVVVTPPTAVLPATPTVQDALIRPFDFTFDSPIPFADAIRSLSRSLNIPIAIDHAAMERVGIDDDVPVELALKGARLKTGLKLLLDQLDLTYRVEPEDNLLIITDLTGADDPLSQVLSELKALHRDMHDLQDAVDEIRDAMGLDAEGGPRMHKPTIIEEMPAEDPVKEKPSPRDHPSPTPPARSRTGA